MATNDIKKMSTHQRLQMMEQIWDSLIEENKAPDSPQWHQEILKQRQQRIDSGEAKFLSIDELKKLKSV